MKYNQFIKINDRKISINDSVYFIADIASNHDGNLDRAHDLIRLAKQSGADAVKFQHFRATKIVSDYGFSHLKTKIGHQNEWKKSVFDTYKEYECPREWTLDLIETARKEGIDLLTTPYDFEAVDLFKNVIPAFKIGSGDITWTEFLEYIALQGKPVLLATGASSMGDVERAVAAVLKHNRNLVLLQCNTNYTGCRDNFRYVNLNVLKTYAKQFPRMVLGFSDHTPGYTAVLGAVSLGARVIEKHFTDDNNRVGPDHSFSMNPRSWKDMVENTRDLEVALGSGIKTIEKNENETAIIQRRCIRAAHELKPESIINRDDLEILRPSILGAVQPYDIDLLLGKKIKTYKQHGEDISLTDMELS
ncbi:MAG: N-acetylneuraminate synthase [Methanomicrobiales archaeon HGW-Methanomicrobiales-1]|nr:MAG: N-acetylneuraminate synthase [Methanomicrobiales archaeon HGW-Methanomicrobiales-1]